MRPSAVAPLSPLLLAASGGVAVGLGLWVGWGTTTRLWPLPPGADWLHVVAMVVGGYAMVVGALRIALAAQAICERHWTIVVAAIAGVLGSLAPLAMLGGIAGAETTWLVVAVLGRLAAGPVDFAIARPAYLSARRLLCRCIAARCGCTAATSG